MNERWRKVLLAHCAVLMVSHDQLLRSLPQISAEHRSADDTVIFEETLELATQLQLQVQKLRQRLGEAAPG